MRDARKSAEVIFRRHRVFGGRAKDLAALDDFAAEPDPGVFLLTGRSGYGKTALLAHWIDRRLNAGTPTVFHFLSSVDGLADQSTALESLCRQLATWHGLRGTLPTGAAALADLYGQLLRQPHKDGKPLTVVIDALDEADWDRPPGRWLVEPPLPSGVHVVLSAREIADTDWIDILDLRDGRVETRVLGGLSAEDSAEMLTAAGGAAAERASDHAFATRLATLADGDPYFLRLLVDDVRAEQLSTLEGLDPDSHDGLNKYFACWWRELTKAAGAEEVRDLLGYLVASESPIPRRDLIDICRDDALDSFRIEPAIDAVQRHLVGNVAHGYTLSHARFRDYLSHSAITTGEQAEYRDRLLEYCAAWPQHRSGYALERYAQLLQSAERLDELLALVRDPAWTEAKLALDSSGGSFKRDLETARAATRKRSTEVSPEGGEATRIAAEIGVEMRLATVAGFAGKMPASILRELLVSRSWSEAQVLTVLREIPDARRRADTIEVLAPDLSRDGAIAAATIAHSLPLRDDGGWARPRPVALAALGKRGDMGAEAGIAAEAFATRTEMADDADWLRIVVSALAPRLTQAQLLEAVDAAAALVSVAPGVIETIGDALIGAVGLETALTELERRSTQLAATVVVHLCSSLTGDAPAALVDCACALPPDQPDGHSPRGASLVALAGQLSPTALEQASRAAEEIASPEWRLWTLAHLAGSRAPAIDMVALLDEARRLEQPSWRANVLATLAPLAPNPETVATEALAVAAEIDDDFQKAAALGGVAAHLPDSELKAAVATALTLTAAELVGESMAALAERLRDDELSGAVRQAIEKIRQLEGHAVSRAEAATTLAAHLPADERGRVVAELIAELGNESAGALVALAPNLDDALWEQCIALGEATRQSNRAATLGELAGVAPEHLRGRVSEGALAAARELPIHEHAVYESSPRADALAELLGILPAERVPEVVTEVLAALRVMGDSAERGLLLAELLPLLDDEQRRAAFALAAEATPEDRPSSLIRLMADANEEEGIQLLDNAEELPEEDRRRILALAAERLPGAAAERARGALRSIVEDEATDIAVVLELAGALSGDLFESVLTLAERAETVADCLRIVVASAPRLDDSQLRRGLTLLNAKLPADLVDEQGQSPHEWAIRNMQPRLTDAVATEALDLAGAIADADRRLLTQLLLAPILPPQRRAAVVAQAAQRLGEEATANQVVDLAVRLLPHQSGDDADVTAGLLTEALQVFVDEAEPEHAIEAIHIAAPLLHGAHAQTALDWLERMPDEDTTASARAQVYASLGADDAGDRLDETIARVLAIDDPGLRWDSIVKLAPIASAERRRELVESATRAAMAFDGVGAEMAGQALAALQLSPEDRRFVLRQALAATAEEQPVEAQPVAERTIVRGPIKKPEGPEAISDQPVFRERTMPDGRRGIERVAKNAVAMIQSGMETSFHDNRLDQLPDADRVVLIAEVIACVGAHDPELLTQALAPLARHLPLDALPPLIAANRAGAEWERALAIELLAPPLPKFVLMRPICRRRRRREARDLAVLSALTPALQRIDADQRNDLLTRMLEVFTQQPRPYFVVDLQAVLPLITALDDSAPRALASELIDIGAAMP